MHELSCPYTHVADLSPLQGMQLQFLDCMFTPVSDLSPLKGMPLTDLSVNATRVADMSLLKGMPLKELGCDFDPERDMEIVRSIKTLKTINWRLTADFWKEVETLAPGESLGLPASPPPFGPAESN